MRYFDVVVSFVFPVEDLGIYTTLPGYFGPDDVYVPNEAAGDSLFYVDFGRVANDGEPTDGFYADYPSSATLGTLNDDLTSSQMTSGSANTVVDGEDNGGILSGLDASGVGSGVGGVRYDNANARSLHDMTSPGGDSFIVIVWVNQADRLSASQGSMYLGAPYTTQGSSEKWYMGINQNRKANFYIQSGADSAAPLGATTLATPWQGQLWALYHKGVECSVGFNGVEDAVVTPPVGMGDVLGSESHGQRLHLWGTNSPANYANSGVGIINRIYLYRIGTERLPANPLKDIILDNYNKVSQILV